MRPLSSLRLQGPRSEPWMMVGLALFVGAASAGLAVLLRSGVHHLALFLSDARESPLGFLIPAGGALVGVLFIRVIFREPGGHGVPAVLEAVSRRGGFLRRRSIFSRLLGSLVNVASGGSAGLEGPVAYSAAALGSSVAGSARLAERQRIILLACGVAGGIGAIFNAPLAGIIFAAEVVLAELTLATVIPVSISAIVATEIGRKILGASGAFSAGSLSWGTADLGFSAVLGLCAGAVSVLFVKSIFKVEHIASKVKAHSVWGTVGVVAAVAGLLVGLLGLLHGQILGEGYGLVQSALSGNLSLSLKAIAGLWLLKMLATSLTLGSNAPGGIFAPSLVLGALLGYGFGSFLQDELGIVGLASPSFFALLAMAGLVAGTMQAPFTGIFLALETTGGWGQTLPLILVAMLSALVSKTFLRHSFYTWELAESGRLLRPGTDQRILADLTAVEMLDEECISVEIGKTLEDVSHQLATTHRNHFAVLDEEKRLRGMLDISNLRSIIFDADLRRLTTVETVMDSNIPRILTSDSLLQAMQVFEDSGAWVLPVVQSDGLFCGTVSKSNLFDNYRRELIVQTADRGE
ncbi:MAG: chloride channel protein [Planctomycetota bacterium]|nr:chloride channel protein [Planctomycetota bacterium]